MHQRLRNSESDATNAQDSGRRSQRGHIPLSFAATNRLSSRDVFYSTDPNLILRGSNRLAAGTSSFSNKWPSNFCRRRYEWLKLARLYQDADAVVVTLLPNIYAARITKMVEGMASSKPIIVTQSEGLAGYLYDEDAVTLDRQGSVSELRAAILTLTSNPDLARSRGQRAAEIATEQHQRLPIGLFSNRRGLTQAPFQPSLKSIKIV